MRTFTRIITIAWRRSWCQLQCGYIFICIPRAFTQKCDGMLASKREKKLVSIKLRCYTHVILACNLPTVGITCFNGFKLCNWQCLFGYVFHLNILEVQSQIGTILILIFAPNSIFHRLRKHFIASECTHSQNMQYVVYICVTRCERKLCAAKCAHTSGLMRNGVGYSRRYIYIMGWGLLGLVGWFYTNWVAHVSRYLRETFKLNTNIRLCCAGLLYSIYAQQHWHISSA